MSLIEKVRPAIYGANVYNPNLVISEAEFRLLDKVFASVYPQVAKNVFCDHTYKRWKRQPAVSRFFCDKATKFVATIYPVLHVHDQLNEHTWIAAPTTESKKQEIQSRGFAISSINGLKLDLAEFELTEIDFTRNQFCQPFTLFPDKIYSLKSTNFYPEDFIFIDAVHREISTQSYLSQARNHVVLLNWMRRYNFYLQELNQRRRY